MNKMRTARRAYIWIVVQLIIGLAATAALTVAFDFVVLTIEPIMTICGIVAAFYLMRFECPLLIMIAIGTCIIITEAVKQYEKEHADRYAAINRSLFLYETGNIKEGLLLTWQIMRSDSSKNKSRKKPETVSMQKAVDFYNRGDYKSAFAAFSKLAGENNVEAQFALGLLYAKSHGVQQDYAQAAMWYRRAAEQGLAKAQNNLGVLYKEGRGVARDAAQAAHWFRKAAEQGEMYAQYNLGTMYLNGEGVPRDRAQAEQWFRKAADQGHRQARRILREMRESARHKAAPGTAPRKKSKTTGRVDKQQRRR